MNFNEYQERARETAVYPREHAAVYPALGLAGEAGEVANQAKKVLRDDGGLVTPARRLKLADEMGDCLWYLAQLATDLGLSLDDLAAANLEKLGARRQAGTLRGDARGEGA